jgi:TolA-binding protein
MESIIRYVKFSGSPVLVHTRGNGKFLTKIGCRKNKLERHCNMQTIATPRTSTCGLGRHALALPFFLLFLALAAPGSVSAQNVGDPNLGIFLKARDFYDKGNFPLAVREHLKFLKAAPKHPRIPDSKWGLGLAYVQLKQWAPAEGLMGELAAGKTAPDLPGAFYYWGQSLLMLRKPANAEAAFLEGLKLKPKARLAGFRMGLLEARFQQKKWKAVKTSVAALPAEEQADERVMFQGGYASFMLRDFKSAAKELGALKQRVGEAPFAHQTRFFLAESLRELGQIKEAIPEYAAARKLPGEYAADALYREGFLNFQIKQYREAAGLFAQFRNHYKQHQLRSAAGLSLGQAHLENRNYKEADFIFTALAKERGANAAVALWHSRVFKRQKKYAAAAAILAPAVNQFRGDATMDKLLFELAENLFGGGEYAESATVFERLMAEHPKHSQREMILRLSAQARFRTGRYAAGLALCADYLEAYPKHPEAATVVFLKGESQFFLGKYADAAGTFEQLLKAHPKHAQARAAQMHIGECYFFNKKWKDALAAFEKLADEKRTGAVFQQYDFNVGSCHYRLKDWEKAVVSFQLFTSRFPKAQNTDTALMKTGLALEAQEQTDNALSVYEQLAENYPKSVHYSQAALKAGGIQFEAKQYAKVQITLKPTAQKKGDPNQSLAIYYLGFASAETGKTDEAIVWLEQLANEFPKDPNAAEARLKAGELQLIAEQFDAAQKSYEKFFSAFPNHKRADDAHFFLAQAQAGQEQWDAAIKSYLAVREKSERKDEALYQSAWCDRKAGRAADARKKYEGLISNHPESPEAANAKLELAELEYEAAKYKDAIGRLEKLIETDTDRRRLALAQFRLAHCHSQLKDWEKAGEAFQTFLTTNLRHELTRKVRLGLGRVQIEQGEEDDALRSLSRAVRGSDGDEVGAEAQFLRGEIYRAQEKFDEAIAEYAKVEAFKLHEPWRADALWGQALALEGKGDAAEATDKLKELLTQFPNSTAAQKAKEKLTP